MSIKDRYYLIKKARMKSASDEQMNVLYASLIGQLRRSTPSQLEDLLQDEKIFTAISALVKDINYTHATIEDIIVSCFVLNVNGGYNK